MRPSRNDIELPPNAALFYHRPHQSTQRIYQVIQGSQVIAQAYTLTGIKKALKPSSRI